MTVTAYLLLLAVVEYCTCTMCGVTGVLDKHVAYVANYQPVCIIDLTLNTNYQPPLGQCKRALNENTEHV